MVLIYIYTLYIIYILYIVFMYCIVFVHFSSKCMHASLSMSLAEALPWEKRQVLR